MKTPELTSPEPRSRSGRSRSVLAFVLSVGVLSAVAILSRGSSAKSAFFLDANVNTKSRIESPLLRREHPRAPVVADRETMLIEQRDHILMKLNKRLSTKGVSVRLVRDIRELFEEKVQRIGSDATYSPYSIRSFVTADNYLRCDSSGNLNTQTYAGAWEKWSFISITGYKYYIENNKWNKYLQMPSDGSITTSDSTGYDRMWCFFRYVGNNPADGESAVSRMAIYNWRRGRLLTIKDGAAGSTTYAYSDDGDTLFVEAA